MSDTGKCPECGTEVPEPTMASQYGTGPGESGHPLKQFAQCRECRSLLERVKNGPWRLRR